jgi:hypothetical protein
MKSHEVIGYYGQPPQSIDQEPVTLGWIFRYLLNELLQQITSPFSPVTKQFLSFFQKDQTEASRSSSTTTNTFDSLHNKGLQYNSTTPVHYELIKNDSAMAEVFLFGHQDRYFQQWYGNVLIKFFCAESPHFVYIQEPHKRNQFEAAFGTPIICAHPLLLSPEPHPIQCALVDAQVRIEFSYLFLFFYLA